VEIVLLKSKVLRAIGLVDKAVTVLGDRAEYTIDLQLRAKMSFELVQCYLIKGDLKLAHKNLTQILAVVEPGPLAHEVALELANVCLELGRNSQAVSICSQLIDLDPEAQIKQKASGLLATAYKKQENYDRAIVTLLGEEDKAEVMEFDGHVDTGRSLN
jgi:tetratricopeptide (TPR) repeat protein